MGSQACAHSPVISAEVAVTMFTGCIYTYCHPFVLAAQHHLFFQASFFVLYDRPLRISARPVKNDWLHRYVKADFIFRW